MSYLHRLFSFNEDARALESLARGKYDHTFVFVLRRVWGTEGEGGLHIFVQLQPDGSVIAWGYEDGSVQGYKSFLEAFSDLARIGAIAV